MTTNDHESAARAASGGSGAEQVAAHHDAAFYHESAAFHHRQAALHLAGGRAADAERHVWAAFGHSLNAHETTRAAVSAMRSPGPPPGVGPGRADGAPLPDPRHPHPDHN